jgi:hypothetical protein
MAEAEAYKEAGTEKQAIKLWRNAYSRARSRIAQEISRGDMAAYLPGENGEFSALPAEHELMKQIRSFIVDGVKTVPRYGVNEITRREYRLQFGEVVNMEWVARLYIPVDAGSPVKQAPCDWGKHTSPNLELLKRAIAEFWEGHNPEAPPKGELVIPWLRKQKVSGRKVSLRLAEAIDTIMRTEEAKQGGNKSTRVTPTKPSK